VSDQKLRIGVDIATLRPPFTGIANYEVQLLSRLLRQMPDVLFLGYRIYSWHDVDETFFASCASSDAPLAPRKGSPLRYSTLVHSLRNRARQAMFSASVGTKNLTLYHAFSYRPPGRLRVPVIPVVYDLSTVRHPETHPRARLKWMEPLEKLCWEAPLIHTISKFSASEIESVFGVSRDKIVVVPPGVNPLFLQLKPPARETLAKFGVSTGSYVMSVSTIEPRKNLKTLILAYADLPTIIKASMPLLIVGARGWGEMDLPKSLAGLEAEGSVRFAGYVSDRELRDLYAGARAMFYPSLYEGFGMPITEALACGTPVVTSQSSSMPDAGGSVSRYVAPLDIDGWRQEFKRTLASEDHLDVGARQDRLAHAQSFSWDEAADTVEAMYRSLL
jgi:glycosyltransferase involved in cell wall biosynthesis